MVAIRTTVLTLLPFLGSVLGYANPRTCTGTCTNAHDPSIIRRADGTYFRFATNGRIAVHTAPDISGPWTYRGAALPGGSSINLPGNTDLWVSLQEQLKPCPILGTSCKEYRYAN